MKEIGQNVINEYYDIVKDVQIKLGKDHNWKKKYYGYCDKIIEKKDNFINFTDKFHKWKPFTYNVVISTISAVKVDLRYKGQTVGKLYQKEGDIVLSTKDFDESNKSNFKCKVKVENKLWNSSVDSKLFRDYFKKEKPERINNNKRNEEHRIESLLVSYFEKKGIWGLKPLKIFNKVRFAMNTPICASDTKNIKVKTESGGGIDILARCGVGSASRLTVIEVKDENKSDEPPEKVMKQAIAYATFIRELLRAEQNPKRDNTWWKLFGYTRELPDPLQLNVVVAMPFAYESDKKNNGNNVNFKSKRIYLDEDKKEKGDFLELHYIYFKEENSEITKIETSLK